MSNQRRKEVLKCPLVKKRGVIVAKLLTTKKKSFDAKKRSMRFDIELALNQLNADLQNKKITPERYQASVKELRRTTEQIVSAHESRKDEGAIESDEFADAVMMGGIGKTASSQGARLAKSFIPKIDKLLATSRAKFRTKTRQERLNKSRTCITKAW